MTRGEFLLYLFFFGALLNALFNYATIVKKKCLWVLDALLKILVLLYLYGSATFFQTSLLHTVCADNMLVVMYTLGLNFAKLVGLLQLAHISGANFGQFSFSILASLSLLNATTLLTVFLQYPLFITI